MGRYEMGSIGESALEYRGQGWQLGSLMTNGTLMDL